MTNNFYKELPGQLEPFQTPFDKAGDVDMPCKFIYVTNRSSDYYSGLLPIDFAMGWELTDYFPMGYAQLWFLEKIIAFHSKYHLTNKIRADRIKDLKPRYPSPKKLDRPKWKGNLYMALREPIDSLFYGDILIGTTDKERAIKKAKEYTDRYKRRSVVALLVGDSAWH